MTCSIRLNSERVIQGDRATFQVDTSAGFSQIDSQCNQNAPLNFVIDFQNQPAASALLDAVKEAKASQTNVGVNGQGNCFTGGEFETVDSVAI